MDILSKSLAFFLISLNLGFNFFLFTIDTRQTGAGLAKLFHSLAFGCLLCLFFTLKSSLLSYTPNLLLLVAPAFLLVVAFLTRQDQPRIVDKILYAAQLVLGLGLFTLLNPSSLLEWLYLLSSGLMLGVITFAMVLGHWYLVTPKLSEKPILWCLYALWGIMLLKLPFTPYTLHFKASDFELLSETGSGSFNWMLLMIRFGWSYFLIAIMSYFTFRLTKMRSLQSATGVLYVMTFFEFGGELIGVYLHYKLGWSL